MQSEKRKNPRLDFGVVIIHNHKRGMAKDISTNGAFISRGERYKQIPLLPIGEDISFSFDFPNTDNYIDVEGTVIHHGNDDGMGVWFKKIDERSKEFIRKFILDYL